MEKLNRNFHVKLQEMCDCYMDTDYLSELGKTAAYKGKDIEENSMKYLALAILEALTQQAEKLKIKKSDKVQVTVTSRDEKRVLPAPTDEMIDKIFEVVRAITHIEDAKGESQLAFGLRSGNLDITVTMKKKEDEESLKLAFTELEQR